MKKIISILLGAVMALSMSACTMSTPSVVMTVENEEIPAGLYLLYQMQAYTAAGAKAEDPEKDLLKTQVEGVPAKEWIHTETVRGIRSYVWAEKEFEAAGLSFTEEEREMIDAQMENIWNVSSGDLEANGVGKESYRLFFENNIKMERLLQKAVEEEDGRITDEEAKKYMDEKYFRIGMLVLPVTNDNGEQLDDSGMKKLEHQGRELAEKLNGGADFDEACEEALKKACETAGREYSEDVLKMVRTKGFIQADSKEYPEEIVKNVVASKVGQADIYTGTGVPMIYQHIANYEDDKDFTENYRGAIISEITGKNMQERMETESAAFTVEENASAVRTYSPAKIKL